MPIFCQQPGATTITTPAVSGNTTVVQDTVTHSSSMASSVLLGIVLFIIAVFIQALLVMLLWNWVMPKIFPTLPLISFGTAFGLVLLIDVLSGVWAHPFWGFGRK